MHFHVNIFDFQCRVSLALESTHTDFKDQILLHHSKVTSLCL